MLDFHTGRSIAWQGEESGLLLPARPRPDRVLHLRHVEDWINELFLSCRFQAAAQGRLQRVRLQLVQVPHAGAAGVRRGLLLREVERADFFESDGYRIQRRCPHLKADLTRFGEIDDGVLTCTLHGWQFELETGRCLTSDDRHLYTQKIDASGAVAESRSDGAVTHAPLEQPTGGASIRDRCYDCWYDPKKFPAAKKKRPVTEE